MHGLFTLQWLREHFEFVSTRYDLTTEKKERKKKEVIVPLVRPWLHPAQTFIGLLLFPREARQVFNVSTCTLLNYR